MSETTRRVWIPVLGFALCFQLVAILDCARRLPTGANGAPELRYLGATGTEPSEGDGWWVEQKACVGFGGVLDSFPVYIWPEAVACDSKVDLRAGCTRAPKRIDVARPWYENALTHEFVHLALYFSQQPDKDHGGPIWARCDWRNHMAAAASGQSYGAYLNSMALQ